MDTYKLTYFNLRGIAEPIRLIFNFAEVPFEDNQIDWTKWQEVKKDIKWQQVPYLEHNGKVLTQSTAIMTFLAKKFGLYPEDAWEQARLDEIMGAVNDLRLHVKPFVLAKLIENDAERAKEMKQQLMLTTVPVFLENINGILSEIPRTSSSSSFILGGEKPSGADFYLAHFSEHWVGTLLEDPGSLCKHQFLQKQKEAVFGLSKVTEYIAKRPKCLL